MEMAVPQSALGLARAAADATGMMYVPLGVIVQIRDYWRVFLIQSFNNYGIKILASYVLIPDQPKVTNISFVTP